MTLDGALLSWGDNKKGKLGLGSGGKTQDVVFEPSPASEAWDPLERVWIRCHFRRVWVGKHHCAASDKSGGFYTWGDNAMGQLGLGDRYPGPSAPRSARIRVRGCRGDPEVLRGAALCVQKGERKPPIAHAPGCQCFGSTHKLALIPCGIKAGILHGQEPMPMPGDWPC